jgi:hypothetical protein
MTDKPYCSDVVDEINQKMFARNIASGNLDTLLDQRPQPTKYVMPFQNIYPPCRSQTVYYKGSNDFNPGNKLGAWSGFATNINHESILRNQIYANQKFPQASYAPNSTSELYNSTMPKLLDNDVETQFPALFNGNIVKEDNHNNLANPNKPIPSYLKNLGNNLFNNDTRQQLKDS